ncbi:MAG: peroxidase family protein [Bacteroidota bacterium]
MQSLQKTHFHLHDESAFSKLFPELPALYVPEQKLQKLAARMVEYSRCLDSTHISNGQSIFSQFLAHDMTFESSSKLRSFHDPSVPLQNDRSFNLDLDCVYGQWTQDFLYDAQDRSKLLLGEKYSDLECGYFWTDLQRNAQHKAIIPDARNDENVIVSRMQVLFIDFHNKVVDVVRKETGAHNVFQAARKRVIWHYQWLILQEFLQEVMEKDIYDDIYQNGSTYFCHPSGLPLEFTGAAFRVGHSQTREENRINAETVAGLFELGAFEKMDQYLDWRYMFDFGDGCVQMAKKIDSKIAKAFHNIPFIRTDRPIERSLPYRNLRRGIVYGLPSGEDIAKRMSIVPIVIPEKEDLEMSGTPLWFYILKEAEILHDGERLGPVGSRLIGEVFMTVMREDDASFLKVHPLWQPDLGPTPGSFSFQDMIQFVYPQMFTQRA